MLYCQRVILLRQLYAFLELNLQGFIVSMVNFQSTRPIKHNGITIQK